MEKVYDSKRLIGELLGAAIAIVWVCYALIAPDNMVFLAVAISLTILFGVLSGGLFKLSAESKENK